MLHFKIHKSLKEERMIYFPQIITRKIYHATTIVMYSVPLFNFQSHKLGFFSLTSLAFELCVNPTNKLLAYILQVHNFIKNNLKTVNNVALV